MESLVGETDGTPLLRDCGLSEWVGLLGKVFLLEVGFELGPKGGAG